MTIRTRFAPSPTGYLHIGGVRTALFNWLLTRRLGGQFILRIDDTDAERNRPEALQPILDGFRWLGIQWDEGPEVGGPHAPYFQSGRSQRYIEVAKELIARGEAYPDSTDKDTLAALRMTQGLEDFRSRNPNPTEAELEAEKKEIINGKRKFVFRGDKRNDMPAENLKAFQQGISAVRLKVPDLATLSLDDQICGKVDLSIAGMSDPIIIRPDGSPLYNFATVVDDYEFKISHVIRAREHLSNTASQLLVYRALGATPPVFAHVPVVNEPPPNQNKKLSKRNMKKFVTPEIRAKLKSVGWSEAEIDSRDDLNPATVAYYREMGYLPSGLVNYLGRLGWSLDDKTEVMSVETMIEKFSLDRVNDSPASFDPEKLLWVAGEHMKVLPVADRIAGCLPFLVRAKIVAEPIDEATHAKIARIVEACGDRIKVFSDILQHAPVFFRDPEYDPKAVDKRLRKDGAMDLLRAAAEELKAASSFAVADLEQRLKAWSEARGVKIGDLNHVLRVATTGQQVGIGLFETLSILGKEESLLRIDLASRIVLG